MCILYEVPQTEFQRLADPTGRYYEDEIDNEPSQGGPPRFSPYPGSTLRASAEQSSQLHPRHALPLLPSSSSRGQGHDRSGDLRRPIGNRSHRVANQGPVRGPRVYPIARVSWFPTPESLNAMRKGNLGHWTGKMEKMWIDCIKEITVDLAGPKSASYWAKACFGSVSKHIWKGTTTASTHVIAHSC